MDTRSTVWMMASAPRLLICACLGMATTLVATPVAANQTIKVSAQTASTGDWTQNPSLWVFGPGAPFGVIYPRDNSTYAYQVGIGPSGHITVDRPIKVSRVKIDAGARLDVDTGEFVVADGNLILPLTDKEALIVNGTLNVQPGAWMMTGFFNITYAGTTLLNNNRINLNATDAAFATAAILTDGGCTNETGAEIVMSDVPADLFGTAGNYLEGEDLAGTVDPSLTNKGTLRGAGTVMYYWGGITNTGLVHADGVNPIIFASNGTVVNQGTMRGSGAGGFYLATGAFTNNGDFELIDSKLELGAAATLTGGTVDTSGTSTILFHGGTSTFDVDNSGDLTVQNASPPPALTGGLLNHSGASLTVECESTLVGTLTNLGELLVREANPYGSSPLTVNRLENSSDVTLDWGRKIVISAGDATHAYSQTAGTTTLKSGTIDASLAAGGIQISGGSIEGQGTLVGNVYVSGTGSIDPGLSFGTIYVDGVYRMTGGTIHMEIGESGGLPENDFVAFWAPVVYTGGTIVIDFVGGYTPNPGNSFQLFEYTFGYSGTPTVVVHGPYGMTVSPDGQTFTVTQIVPEPAALGLLGLAVLVLRKRRS